MQSIEDQEFEDIAMSHVDGLFQTALHMTTNRRNAEKVVCEAYSCARKAFQQREDQTDCRLQLFRILFRRIRGRNRSWPWGQPRAVDRCSQESALSALARVPARFREVLLVVDCQDFSYQEAAVILETTVEAVTESLARGREFLEVELTRGSELQDRRIPLLS